MSKSIYLDWGHGGRDGGASGNGIQEKAWTRRITLYQYDRLKELGAKVYITRRNDTTFDPNPRTAEIRRIGADYVISNHWNAFSSSSAHGVETIHSIYANKAMANDLCNAIVKVSGLHKRRVFSKGWNNGDYYFMHRNTGKSQTTIIEYGFLTNARDANWFKNDNNFFKAAEAVIEVICKYIGVTYRTPEQMKKKEIKETPKDKESIEYDRVSVEVALQDLRLTPNQWKTREVKVEGEFTLAHNIHYYKGLNFDMHEGLLTKGTKVKFDLMAVPNKGKESEHRWLRGKADGETIYFAFATEEMFDKGEYWGTFE